MNCKVTTLISTYCMNYLSKRMCLSKCDHLYPCTALWLCPLLQLLSQHHLKSMAVLAGSLWTSELKSQSSIQHPHFYSPFTITLACLTLWRWKLTHSRSSQRYSPTSFKSCNGDYLTKNTLTEILELQMRTAYLIFLTFNFSFDLIYKHQREDKFEHILLSDN